MADAAVARQLQFAFAAADSTPAQRPGATPSALSPATSACTAGSTASQHGQRAWARASQVHHSSPGIGSASVVHAAQAHAAATPASTSWTTFSQGQSFAFSARHHVHTERSAAASPSPAGGRLSGSSNFRSRAAAGREAPAFVRYGLPADASPATGRSSGRSSRVYRAPRGSDTSGDECDAYRPRPHTSAQPAVQASGAKGVVPTAQGFGVQGSARPGFGVQSSAQGSGHGTASGQAPAAEHPSASIPHQSGRAGGDVVTLGVRRDQGSHHVSLVGSNLQHQLRCLEMQIRSTLQVESGVRQVAWSEAWQQAEAGLDEQLLSISTELRDKEMQLQRADDRLKNVGKEERDQRLRQLQRLHEEAAAVQKQHVAKLQRQVQEEAERRAAEARRRQQEEEERRRKEEAEKKAAEEARKAAEEAEQRKKEAEAQKAAAAAQASAAAAAAAKRASTAPSQLAAGGASANGTGAVVTAEKASAAARCMRIAPQAAQWEKDVAKRSQELGALIQPLLTSQDPAVKKQVRELSKKMNVHVQQISATLDQVSKKCVHIYQLIRSQPDEAWRTLAMQQFVSKVCKQEDLVLKNNRAAFPIATVVVKLSTQFPELMELMIAELHKEVPVSVPMSFVHDPSLLSTAQYYRLMGFKERDGVNPGDPKVFESPDDLLHRVEGLMLLYGAIVQVDEPANPHGLDHGWRWLSRALNSLPADRVCSKALSCFLRSGGYGLHRRFKGQFVKLLRCMYDSYLPQLAVCSEPDVAPTRTQLDHYYSNRQYLKEPEGRQMPNVDQSAYFVE